MSEDVVDVNGPWWKAGKLPMIDSHYSISWAIIGLGIQAIFGGKPILNQTSITAVKDDDTIDGFLKRLSEKFPELRQIRKDLSEYKKGDATYNFVVEHGAVTVEFDGDTKLEIQAVSRETAFMEAFAAFLAENTSKSIPKGRVHVLINTANGPEFRSMGIGGHTLERGNYEDEVMKGYDRICNDLQAATPAGRVAILDGKPGTGKTFLVRGILDQIRDVIFVIVPANLIAELAQPGMIPALVDLHKSRGDKPMVFVVEDADEVLAPRMGDNMSSVSALLNLGDGILGQLLDVRILATTNAHHQDIDEAIKRPGRLSAMVHVGPMSAEKAGEVYQRLTGKPPYKFELDKMVGPLFNGKATLAEVYQKARNEGWTPPQKERKMGFSSNEDEDDDY